MIGYFRNFRKLLLRIFPAIRYLLMNLHFSMQTFPCSDNANSYFRIIFSYFKYTDLCRQVFNDIIVFSNSHLLMNQHNKLVFSVCHQIERYVCVVGVYVHTYVCMYVHVFIQYTNVVLWESLMICRITDDLPMYLLCICVYTYGR